MPRTLSVARTAVSREHQAEYLLVLGRLGALLQARGDSLWIFRHPDQRNTFLECSESKTPERHRGRTATDQDEAALERRLRALAAYAADAEVLWEEVPLKGS